MISSATPTLASFPRSSSYSQLTLCSELERDEHKGARMASADLTGSLTVRGKMWYALVGGVDGVEDGAGGGDGLGGSVLMGIGTGAAGKISRGRIDRSAMRYNTETRIGTTSVGKAHMRDNARIWSILG